MKLPELVCPECGTALPRVAGLQAKIGKGKGRVYDSEDGHWLLECDRCGYETEGTGPLPSWAAYPDDWPGAPAVQVLVASLPSSLIP